VLAAGPQPHHRPGLVRDHPHRVRVGCVNAWVQTRSGRLPIIWSTVPTDYGERLRLRLWCPAGITAADLIGASEVLAAASSRAIAPDWHPTGSSPPVADAIDRIADLSPTPSTAPMSVAGVGDRRRSGSMA
jgi:hypothetical protein